MGLGQAGTALEQEVGSEGGVGRGSLDAGDPLVLLLGRGGRDAVEGVVALDDAAVGLRLAGLDHLVLLVRDVELKTVLGIENGGCTKDWPRNKYNDPPLL